MQFSQAIRALGSVVLPRTRRDFVRIALGALGVMLVWVAIRCLGDAQIHGEPDWRRYGNLTGSAVLLWLLLALLCYPRYASAKGLRWARRGWQALAPATVVVLIEWLHLGPAMFANTGTALAWVLFAATMGALTALCGHSAPGQIAVAALWWLLAMANSIKLATRGTPLVPWDIYALGTALDVADGYTIPITSERFFSMLLLVLLCAASWRYRFRLRGAGKRIVTLCASLCVLAALGSALLLPSSPIYLRIPLNNWVLQKVYWDEGFATALIANCKQLIIPPPEGYEPEEVRGSMLTAELPQPPATMSEPPVNIILVMSESLADLEALTPFQPSQPVLSNLRALYERSIHGKLHVSVFGGGTSVTEFEALTGNSAAFLPAECAPYVQYLQPSRRNAASLAWQLKAQGYQTVAVHPADGANWNRDQAYPLLGFDRFLSLRDMPGWNLAGNNLRDMYTDEALFAELLRMMEGKPVGQRLFVHCVTMQNHGGYLIPPLVGVGPRIDHGGVPDEEIDSYLTLVERSDRALGDFVAALDRLEEPTLLLFFGDHQPTVSRNLTKELEGADRWYAEGEAHAQLFEVPMLIWSNRELPPQDLGDTSSQYLGVLLTQVAGLEMNDYQRFLAALSAQWPVFTAQAARDASGAFYTPDEAVQRSPLLQEYRAAQYNLLFDRWGKLEELYWPAEGPNPAMGGER